MKKNKLNKKELAQANSIKKEMDILVAGVNGATVQIDDFLKKYDVDGKIRNKLNEARHLMGLVEKSYEENDLFIKKVSKRLNINISNFSFDTETGEILDGE
jgi:hypothetical protein